jgi:hypothetical protein
LPTSASTPANAWLVSNMSSNMSSIKVHPLQG